MAVSGLVAVLALVLLAVLACRLIITGTVLALVAVLVLLAVLVGTVLACRLVLALVHRLVLVSGLVHRLMPAPGPFCRLVLACWRSWPAPARRHRPAERRVIRPMPFGPTRPGVTRTGRGQACAGGPAESP